MHQDNLSVFRRFEFQTPPVGIKFLFHPPEGIEPLQKDMALCEMIKEAQMQQTPFYAVPKNQNCKPGADIWGEQRPAVYSSGDFGVTMGLFKEPRSDIRVRRQTPGLDKELVRYIAFSPLEKLSFDPDVLIILTDQAAQAEVILRAMSYSSGELWSFRMSPVIGCAWLLAYPFYQREVNCITTGFGSGMNAKRLFPAGHQLISIPCNWLTEITRNLEEIPWVPEAWSSTDLSKFVQEVYTDLESNT